MEEINVKNQKKYEDGILDCCKEDPEAVIMFQLKNEKIEVVAKDKNNPEAVLTANLIMEVFNLKNTGMRVYKSEMRVLELTEEMNKLYDSIEEVNANPDSKFVLRKLKALIRKESRFAAFKRNYIREICQKYTSLLNS